MKKRGLVLMLLLIHISQILLGIFIKGSLTARRAEIIGLPFIFGSTRRSGRVNIHVTDGIVDSGCHISSSFVERDYRSFRTISLRAMLLSTR